MTAGRQQRGRLGGAADVAVASGVAVLVGVVALLGLQRVGVMAAMLPIAAVAALVLIQRPALAVFGAVGLTILVEGSSFELLGFANRVYTDLGGGVTPIDALFAIATVATGLRVLREGRGVVLPPRLLSLALALVVLALAGGAVVTRAAGVSPTSALLAAHGYVYLVLVPLLVVNLELGERQVKRVLGAIAVLAIVKALLGIAALLTGRGMDLDGSVLTYYAPVANWLTMLVALATLAALLMRAGPPTWLVAALPLVVASLVFSYRRSFWVGFALAGATLVLLGLSPLGRRLLVPILALFVAAAWMLGTVAVQSDGPVAQRLQSLAPTQIEANPEDRYRIDERANVLGALRDHPVTGIGLEVPWPATERSLPVESNPERTYVHFAALSWWLKLGLLGLAAFAATMASAAQLSWRIWRRARDPLIAAVGLASLCGLIGLLVIEMTASFTGVDVRFTIAFGAQLGLLAVIARQVSAPPGASRPPG